MVFACQKDSFLKKFAATVISCEPVSNEILEDCAQTHHLPNGWAVTLDDTIFFPKGGGQPSDIGVLNDRKVIFVKRNGEKAVHYVEVDKEEEPIKVGEMVEMEIDWETRLDHMQQHSGQHLLSALAETELNFETTSWFCGKKESFVELNTNTFSSKDLLFLEKLLNSKIREAIPVNVTTHKVDDPQIQEMRSRGLPDDHASHIRVVRIEGIDKNLCCGTHVSNLSQLQVIKLLRFEKGKKGKTNLYFLVGNRVSSYFSEMYERELYFTSKLKGGPESHVQLIDKLIIDQKQLQKDFTSCLKSLASAEAKNLKSLEPKPKFYFSHQPYGSMDFINVFLREFSDENTTLFLTVGDVKGPCTFVLHGKLEVVTTLGPQINELLGGKGFLNKNKFQGKVPNLLNQSKVEKLIQDFLENA